MYLFSQTNSRSSGMDQLLYIPTQASLFPRAPPPINTPAHSAIIDEVLINIIANRLWARLACGTTRIVHIVNNRLRWRIEQWWTEFMGRGYPVAHRNRVDATSVSFSTDDAYILIAVEYAGMGAPVRFNGGKV